MEKRHKEKNKQSHTGTSEEQGTRSQVCPLYFRRAASAAERKAICTSFIPVHTADTDHRFPPDNLQWIFQGR